MKTLYLTFYAISLWVITGCSSLGYYTQAVTGHFDLMQRREAIAGLLTDPHTDAELTARLRHVQAVRRFAVDTLHLPDNGSYTAYADLERPYVVWNVFATPEFSLEPVQSCFLIAGCLSYRGYFQESAANRHAGQLRAQGYDVYLGGVAAYSTLGWFDDPVLNTMLRHSDLYLTRVIFHELAHQQLYIDNDSAFNEAFASAVEQAGMARWLDTHGSPAQQQAYRQWQAGHDAFTVLVLETVAELRALYGEDLPLPAKRRRKADVVARMGRAAQQAEWGEAYRRWFAEDLNNAKLLTVRTYQAYVPGFLALLEQEGGDFQKFYLAAAALGKLPAAERVARLRQ